MINEFLFFPWICLNAHVPCNGGTYGYLYYGKGGERRGGGVPFSPSFDGGKREILGSAKLVISFNNNHNTNSKK